MIEKLIIFFGVVSFIYRIAYMKEGTERFVPNAARLVMWWFYAGAAFYSVAAIFNFVERGVIGLSIQPEWLLVWGASQIALALYVAGASSSARSS
jgi:hypothetical protein